MLGAIAQFERELMLERQREGIAKAKAEGKYKGRAPTARAKATEIQRLRAEGIGATEIARQLRISRASVYRALNQVCERIPSHWASKIEMWVPRFAGCLIKHSP